MKKKQTMHAVPKIAPAKGMRKFEFQQSRYKHLEGMNVCRSLVVGASGSGKGVLLQSLILDVFTDQSGKSIFQRTYIFSPTINSDHTWEPVKKMLRKKQKIPEEEVIFFETFDVEALNKIIDTQKRVIEYEKEHNFKQLHQICIVVDDFGGDERVMRGKQGEALKRLFLMGRHWGINCFVSIQKFNLASTVMRTQATSIFYFKARSQTDLDVFVESQAALVPGGKKQMMEIYRVATAEPYSFLTVDLLSKDPNKIFMKRFESYLVPS
jgi:ABC-type dipeptide/oligopeptide/nickel transport system ATPase component